MIEIRITADTAAEALKDLTELTHTMAAPAPSAPVSAPKAVKKDKPAPQTTAEPEAVKSAANPTTPATHAEEKVDDAATARVTDTTVPAANSAVSEDAETEVAPTPEKPKKLTLEVIRAAGVEAARKHGKDTVKRILDGMGEVGMTSMSPDNYGVFMGKLGELDA